MSEHTPLPWKLDNLGPRIRRFHLFGPNREGIADIFYNPHDALFIAQACNCHDDLLAIVRRVLYDLNGRNATERETNPTYAASPLCEAINSLVKEAASAIVKAQGNNS